MTDSDRPDDASDHPEVAAAPRPAPPGQPPLPGPTPGPSTAETEATSPDSQSSPRFPATGDAQVDQAVASLPAPDQQLGSDPALEPDSDLGPDDVARADGDAGDDQPGPDAAARLDDQIASVTAVHRRLQQRLSDLSG